MDNEEEQQPIEQQQLPQDLALDEEEGINIELGKLPPYLDDSSSNDDDGQSSNADNNEETAKVMLAAQQSSSSSTQRASRRNQLLTMLAIFAVLCIFALSIGFGVSKVRGNNNSGSTNNSAYKYNDEAVITSSAMGAFDSGDDTDTEVPTSSPVAPLYMSNDLEDDEN